MQHCFIPIEDITAKPYRDILTYPRCDEGLALFRMSKLRMMGITGLCFCGDTRVGRLFVLGKGHAGLVVLARTEKESVAVKIRRLDSRRDGLSEEARLLRAANQAGVGPRLHSYSEDFLIMEFLEGEGIGQWVKSLGGRGAAAAFRRTARQILEDCFELDQIGLDHGELSRIPKHAIISESRATIVDFESASMSRRTANVTSATQGIFIGPTISKRARRVCKIPTPDDIIGALRIYKEERTRESFDHLLSTLRI